MSAEATPAAGSAAGPLVGLVMGSDSDWPVMEAAADALAEFGIPFEADVVSAHRCALERADAIGSGLDFDGQLLVGHHALQEAARLHLARIELHRRETAAAGAR